MNGFHSNDTITKQFKIQLENALRNLRKIKAIRTIKTYIDKQTIK